MAQSQSKVTEILAALGTPNLSEFELFRFRRDLESYLTKNGEDASGFNTLGLVLDRLQQREEALCAFSRAASLEPDEPVYLANVAYSLWETEGAEAALDCILDGFDRSPACSESPISLASLAAILLDQELVESARGVLADAVRNLTRGHVPELNWVETHNNLAIVAGRLGERATAAELRARSLAFQMGEQLGDRRADEYLQHFVWARIGLDEPPEWLKDLLPLAEEKDGEFPQEEGLEDPGLAAFSAFSGARKRATAIVWGQGNG